jgi:hypothetical protein
MPEMDHQPTAQLIADWVRGATDSTRTQRRTRLLAYRRVSQNPAHLGMFLTRVGFDRIMDGAAPGTDPRAWRELTGRGTDGWRHRVTLAHQVLDLLRDVDVTTDRAAAALAQDEAATILKGMAGATSEPGLQAVDWSQGWDEDDMGPA